MVLLFGRGHPQDPGNRRVRQLWVFLSDLVGKAVEARYFDLNTDLFGGERLFVRVHAL